MATQGAGKFDEQALLQGLREQLKAFQDLEAIQGEALAKVEKADFTAMQDLLTRQQEVMVRISEAGKVLQPLLHAFENLPQSKRAALRDGELGILLVQVEGIASGIQSRHHASFEPPTINTAEAGLDSSPGGLDERISIWRARQ